MGKQHELLSVEKNLKNEAIRRMKEGINTFEKKSNKFKGLIKFFESVDEDSDKVVVDEVIMTDNVKDKIDFIFESIVTHFDSVLQKERTNQVANANIVIDDVILAKDIPATTLLGLEGMVLEWKKVLSAVPTLDPGTNWEWDSVKGCYTVESMPKDVKETVSEYQIVAPATKEHPAQVMPIKKSVKLGVSTQVNFSSMLTVAQKSDMLARVDKLINAVKKARARANNTEVIEGKIGKNLVEYILG